MAIFKRSPWLFSKENGCFQTKWLFSIEDSYFTPSRLAATAGIVAGIVGWICRKLVAGLFGLPKLSGHPAIGGFDGIGRVNVPEILASRAFVRLSHESGLQRRHACQHRFRLALGTGRSIQHGPHSQGAVCLPDRPSRSCGAIIKMSVQFRTQERVSAHFSEVLQLRDLPSSHPSEVRFYEFRKVRFRLRKFSAGWNHQIGVSFLGRFRLSVGHMFRNPERPQCPPRWGRFF